MNHYFIDVLTSQSDRHLFLFPILLYFPPRLSIMLSLLCTVSYLNGIGPNVLVGGGRQTQTYCMSYNVTVSASTIVFKMFLII